MDRVVRAVGRIVVWVEAAAELSTMRRSRWVRTLAKPEVPKMRMAEHREHIPLVGRVLRSPMPLVPMPA